MGASDAFTSLGYLIAAAIVTVGGLGAYAGWLAQRYRSIQARYQQFPRYDR